MRVFQSVQDGIASGFLNSHKQSAEKRSYSGRKNKLSLSIVAPLRRIPGCHRYNKLGVGSSAVAEATEEATVLPTTQGPWHAVVANADFMLHDVQNESFAEQLRERRRLFLDKEKPVDFWLVSEPAWLDEQFPSEAKRVNRPCIALVSTDQIWIDFMKLRLDRVLRLHLGEQPLHEVLRSRAPPPKYEPLDKKGRWTAPYPPYRPGWWRTFMQDS